MVTEDRLREDLELTGGINVPVSGLVKICQVCAPFQDGRVPLGVYFVDKLLDVLHVSLTVGLRPLDRVEFRARSFPSLVEHEFIRPFVSFVNNSHDEFRFLRTTVKDALYLCTNLFLLTRPDLIMEDQCDRCCLCHMFPSQTSDSTDTGKTAYCYICAVPPSAKSSMPVTKLESPEARKTTTLAISSGCPLRPSRTCAASMR